MRSRLIISELKRNAIVVTIVDKAVDARSAVKNGEKIWSIEEYYKKDTEW